MKPTQWLACLLAAISFTAVSAVASWQIGPLSERVKGADLIVVGELTDVTQQSFSCQGTYFGLGMIKNPKVLKGSLETPSYVRIAFHSIHQDPKNGLRHMLSPHKAGDRGIWLLYKDKIMTGYHFAIGPANPLSESEDEVIKALREAEPPKDSEKK